MSDTPDRSAAIDWAMVPKPGPKVDAVEETAKRIAAWLRTAWTYFPGDGSSRWPILQEKLADAIERGDWKKGSTNEETNAV